MGARAGPGWHIECSAIAAHHLGATFDVQGGGSDLVFPHHEMSASEAHVLDAGGPFAHAYVHAGMVGYEGEKMSKSRGNLVFVSRLREQGDRPAPPAAGPAGAPLPLRLGVVRHRARRRGRAAGAGGRPPCPARTPATAERLVAEVRDALADDLDAPRALALLDAWADSDEQPATATGPRSCATSSTPASASTSETRIGGSVLGAVAPLEVALELARDRLAAGLGQLGGVAGLLEGPDVVADLLVLLGELVDPALPGP